MLQAKTALAVVMLINILPMCAIGAEVHSLTENNTDAATTESEDVYIVGEAIENRTEFTKEFVLSNGLRMVAVYGEPVHYEEAGEWKNIDNTLRSSGVGDNAVYTNTAGDWDIAFPQQLTGNRSVSVTKDGSLCALR